MKPVKTFDLLILGGGPAGMTAAIYAARANMAAAVVDSNLCGGQVNFTYVVENFPSHKSIHGIDLMQRITDQIEALGVVVDQAAEVIRLGLKGAVKQVETEEVLYRAPALILATGQRPVPLEINTGDVQQVHYCAICDGPPYKGRRVLVVGGGNTGFDTAYYLHSLGVEHIYLIEKMDRFVAAELTQEKLLSCKNVTVAKLTSLVEVIGQDKLTAVRLENTDTGETQVVPMDGIFVCMGQRPNHRLFADVVAVDDRGYVITSLDMETNVAGVFAAGDIRQKKYRQVTTAMADGTIAALAAERFVRSGLMESVLSTP